MEILEVHKIKVMQLILVNGNCSKLTRLEPTCKILWRQFTGFMKRRNLWWQLMFHRLKRVDHIFILLNGIVTSGMRHPEEKSQESEDIPLDCELWKKWCHKNERNCNKVVIRCHKNKKNCYDIVIPVADMAWSSRIIGQQVTASSKWQQGQQTKLGLWIFHSPDWLYKSYPFRRKRSYVTDPERPFLWNCFCDILPCGIFPIESIRWDYSM